MLPSLHPALWLFSSDDGRIVLYAAIGFVAGILLFIRGFRVLQRKRLILDTPTAKVRSAAIGLVELNGQAVGPSTISSPITQRPCFYYRTSLWKEVGSGKNRHWEQKVDERFHVLFYLKDPTGMVLVDPDGAEMDIHCDFKGEYSRSMFSGSSVPPRVADFAGRNGVALDDNVRVEEYCVKPQNSLYILGTLATNSGLEPSPVPRQTLAAASEVTRLGVGGGRAGLTSALLGLANLNFNVSVSRPQPTFAPPATGSREYPVTELDRKMAEHRAQQAQAHPAASGAAPQLYDPKDPRSRSAALAAIAAQDPALAAAAAATMGTSLPQAIASAVKLAAPQVAVAPQPPKEVPKPVPGLETFAVPAQEEEFPDKSPTVIRKGANDPTFYISWRSQKDIVSDLSTRAFLMIFGGPALSALCLWVLLNYFRML